MKYILIILTIFIFGCAEKFDYPAPPESVEIDETRINQAVESAQNLIDTGRYIKGGLIVSFIQTTTKSEAEAILAKYGLEINKFPVETMDEWHEDIKIAGIKVPEDQEIEYIRKLMREPQIAWVELPVMVSIAQ